MIITITASINDTISSIDVRQQSDCPIFPPVADHSVQFYNEWRYGGLYCFGDTAAAYMGVCSGYDENISSVILKSGWSVRLYKDSNLGGTSKCFSANDDDFSNDSFDDGSPLNDQMSSFALYNQSSCPPLLPSPPSGVNASDGYFTDKVVISWDSSIGATYYQIYRNTSNSSSGSFLLSTPSSSPLDDNGALAGTIYWYFVKHEFFRL